jgi:hypothetical protein
MTQLAAVVTLLVSTALSAWCFRGIVRRYQTLLGLPWLLSAAFAVAAAVAVFALHNLLGS